MPALVSLGRAPLGAALLLFAALACPSPARAQWPATSAAGGLALCTAPQYQWYQQAIEDGAGGMFVVWRDDRATGGTSANYDIYAQHVSAAGFPLWGANGVAVCTDVSAQDRPTLCPDGAGGLFVVWSDVRFLSSDLWAQRLDAAGTPQWVANGFRIARLDAANDYAPFAASDGAGGCFVVWSSYDPATGTRVRAQRVNAAGAAQWGTPGVALAGVSGNQTEPRLVADGGALVASWVQAGAPRSVRAQRLGAGGALLWGANGVPVTDTTRAASSTHHLVALATGGVRALAHDTAVLPTPWFRDLDAAGATLRFAQLLPGASWPEIVTSACAGDSGTTLFASTNGSFESAQRVAADGTLDWGPHGRPVSPDTLTRTKFTVVARDGAGGAYLLGIAVDTATVFYELRAQHVRWNASLAWAEEGVTLAEAVSGDQQQPLAVASERGVIGVWQDYRSVATSGLDLYAQRVDSTGALGTPVLDAPGTPGGGVVALAAPWPNPARPGARVTLRFALPVAGRATLALHDVAGRRVAALADGAFAAGRHEVAVDAGSLAPGLYFAHLRAGAVQLTRRIAIVR